MLQHLDHFIACVFTALFTPRQLLLKNIVVAKNIINVESLRCRLLGVLTWLKSSTATSYSSVDKVDPLICTCLVKVFSAVGTAGNPIM